MNRVIFLLSATALLAVSACNQSSKDKDNSDAEVSMHNGIPSVQNTFNNHTLKLAPGYQYDVLFTEKDDKVVRQQDGNVFPAKGKQDFIQYLPIDNSSEHGYLYVNHESKYADSALGDGGGMSWFEVKKENNHWSVVSSFNHIDFSHLGGTWHNCGGTYTPHHTIITAEEYPPASNEELYNNGEYFRDTSDFNGMKRNEVMGWMVEVDVNDHKATQKLWHMGRYSHEDAHCMPDGKTVFLTDDYNPAVFFKFIADQVGDFSKGQLYAFQFVGKEKRGVWLPLPMEMDSLIHARDVAIRMGASMFIRQEWIDGSDDGTIYITETGSDEIDWTEQVAQGGNVPYYFDNLKVGENTYSDPYGRVLQFDPITNTMKVYLEGGNFGKEGKDNFSGADGLGMMKREGKEYLVICEDIIGRSKNRVSAKAEAAEETYNELYLLEAGMEAPALEDLIRFSVGPRGCEQTGPAFTPDYSTMFLSVQNPDKNNPPPFNKTTVVAITRAKPAS